MVIARYLSGERRRRIVGIIVHESVSREGMVLDALSLVESQRGRFMEKLAGNGALSDIVRNESDARAVEFMGFRPPLDFKPGA